jgi:hypothetical protein
MSDFTAQPPPPSAPGPDLDTPLSLRRSFWKEQRATVLVAALVAAVTATGVSALMTTGGPSIGGPRRGTLTQQGSTIVRGEPLEVYYPVPYAGPPNVSLEDGSGRNCVILEQKPDHFKVKLDEQWALNPVSIKWKAEGVPGVHAHGFEEHGPLK